MAIKFGTDGWRAVIGDEFTFESVRKVAYAHAKVLEQEGKKRVVVGYDRRFLSREFAEEVYRVFKTLGFEVYISDRDCTTPMVSFAVKYMGFDGGVMITASHNPGKYNGYKIKESFGGSATPEFVKKVEEVANSIQNVKVENYKPETIDLKGPYLERIKELINLELFEEGLLVHDAMYGSSAGLFSEVLLDTPLEVISIRSRRDPLFGGHPPEPIEKHLVPMFEKVRGVGAKIGIANDGDGDRIALCDERGRFINTQLIYVLLLLHLLKNKGIKEGLVVKTVSTSYLVDRICKSEGVELREVPVGFKHINELILKEKVIFGGEESGGYGIIHFLPERDGLFSGLSILELMYTKGKALSEIVQEVFQTYGSAYFERKDLYADEEKKKKLKSFVENPPSLLGRFKVREAITKDGLKLVFENDGWLLMRASGTEPLIRVYAEMPTQEQTQEVIKSALEML
ncbi:phosphoglucomutase/phosphomannomutase family protein [Thermocrinis sp.]|uniref:phosphoglucomutase/phosphomannomutase family protein n=1 Tax=Thermocrinis sp. TaxID=2024383 RepID=UPI002FDCED96